MLLNLICSTKTGENLHVLDLLEELKFPKQGQYSTFLNVPYNFLCKYHRYNAEVPDSYEHLLLDVIDGDNHLFMRSDELAAAWSILTPILNEIDKKNIAPELYELGGRGPVGAYYLWAKHGVRWADD